MRIAVTGASGFIGQVLVPALAARGHQAMPLGREVLGDIATFADWPRALGDAEVVVHLAAHAHQRGASDERLRAVNVDAPVELGRAAAAAGVRLLFLSSVKALGEETGKLKFDELAAFAPDDAYGRAKADAERSLRAIRGLNLTILRPPLVYGPRVKANFLSLLRAIGRGWPLPFAGIENRRSLIYVGNLCDAIIRCLEVPQAAGRTYSVSDGAPVSTPQLCAALGNALGRPARLFRFPVPLLELAPGLRRLTRSLEVDDSAIRNDLGWRPPYTLEEGLRLTAEWYLAQRG
jgi:nucleoside-diphosphate-sugar epimerase